MKHNKLLLIASCFVLLCGCTSKGGQNSGGGDSSGGDTQPQKEKLAAPVLRMAADNSKIEWDAVEGAVSYLVKDGEGEAVAKQANEREVALNETVGQHSITVVAVEADANYNSDPSSPFAYETANTSIGELTVNGATVTWASLDGTAAMVKGLEDAEFTLIDGDQFVATESDVYTFKAAGGYVAANSKFFVEGATPVTRSAAVSVPAADVLYIERGEEADNATLQDLWDIKKFDSDWVTTSANVTLAKGQALGGENAVKLSYWHHGYWFKLEQAFAQENSYDTLTIDLKGDETQQVTLSFEVKEQVSMAGINLQGVTAKYRITDLVANTWKHYAISMADSNWVVNFNNQDIPFATVKSTLANAGVQVNSIGDLLPFFGAVQVRAKAASDSTGSNAYLYFDEFALSNAGVDSSVVAPVELQQNYAFQCTALGNGRLKMTGANTGVMYFTYQGNQAQLAVSLSVENGKVRAVSTTAGSDFDALFTATENGKKLVLESATGTAAALLTGMQAEAFYMLDDFESYTETGIGYDKSHGKDARTGLRAAYYSDYYGGGNTSPMGGNGWDLMGSTDYLDLYKTNDRNGGQSARLKVNNSNQMRFTTYGLSDGTATELPKGATFAYWVKGGSQAISMKIRLYKIAKVTAATQGDDNAAVISGDAYKVAANADWTLYEFTLPTNGTYYGYSILPLKGASATTYIFVDDICIYNTISPF